VITAVDTSVLLAIAKGESTAPAWADALEKARARGELVICETVAAELSAFWRDEAAYVRFVAGIGATFLPVNERAARGAGRIFAMYRQSGGPREHLIPDFLIAAHALHQTDQLAAIDRGYLRAYFPRLRILAATE
jgi:predicted nucleic acid-binding protein